MSLNISKNRHDQPALTLFRSGTNITANTVSSGIEVRKYSHLIVDVNVTAGSGTARTLDLFHNYSLDGSTWRRIQFNATKTFGLLDSPFITTDAAGDSQLARFTTTNQARMFLVPLLTPWFRLEIVRTGTTAGVTYRAEIAAKPIDLFT